MIGAVVIGQEITREVTFKNGFLVSSKNQSQIMKTKQATFSILLDENTEKSCLSDIKYLTFYINKNSSTLFINLNGFFFNIFIFILFTACS